MTAPPSDAGPGLFAAFGDGGWTTAGSAPADIANAIALQPDGRLVLAGSSGADVLLLRLLPDGRPDPSFGGAGRVVLDFDGGTDVATAVAVQPDGRIIAAGASDGLGRRGFLAVRLTPSGARDPSWGDPFFFFGPSSDDFASAIALQPDGRVLLAGMTVNPSPNFGVARLLADGAPDPSFGAGGRVSGLLSNQSGAAALLLRPDGRVVAGGWFFNGFSMVLAAWVGLTPGGAVDPALGPRAHLPGGVPTVMAMWLDPAGRIVSAISTRGLVRLSSDGGLDPAFGDGGSTAGSAPALSVAPLPDGRLGFAGSTTDAPRGIYIAVVDADGRAAGGFDGGGTLEWRAPAGAASAAGLVVNPDGTIVVAGNFGDDSGTRIVVLKAKP